MIAETQSVDLAQALDGPIATVRTPFHLDGEIDWAGLNAYVERCIANGAVAMMLTYGDSLFTLLTDDEVVAVTKAVTDCVGRRVPVIAADRAWWTGRTVEFATYCRSIGVDSLMVLPPDWTQSCTPDSLVAHYGAVAAEIPILLVSSYIVARGVAAGIEIVERVYDSVDNVVGIKDDFGGDFGARTASLTSDTWAVIAGGTKSLHLHLHAYGGAGYLSTLTLFRPDIVAAYRSATAAGDLAAMATIIENADRPMFDILRKSPGGFDAAIHGWCELAGICGRWRRGPYRSLADVELDQLAARLDAAGLLSPSLEGTGR